MISLLWRLTHVRHVNHKPGVSAERRLPEKVPETKLILAEMYPFEDEQCFGTGRVSSVHSEGRSLNFSTAYLNKKKRKENIS